MREPVAEIRILDGGRMGRGLREEQGRSARRSQAPSRMDGAMKAERAAAIPDP